MDTTDHDDGVLRIDCGECEMRGTSTCADCVVTYICSHEPDQALLIDADEARAMRNLARAGLVPRLRHVRRTG